MSTEHYYSRSIKYGGAEYSADGLQATVIGAGIIIIGLLPMTLWAKSAKAAGLYAAICLIAGLILITGAPLFTR